jgi:polyferredoxin
MSKFALRRMIQAVAFLSSVLFVVLSVRFIGHQYCPYAVICFGLRSLNPQTRLVFASTVVAGLIIMVSTLFIGRRFCGYICPLGTLSEYLNYLNPWRKKLSRKRIPIKLEQYIRIGKYVVLLFTATASLIFLSTKYFDFCPVMVLTSLSDIWLPGIITLVVVGIGSILMIRFWCRVLCPYAALMNCVQYLGRKLKLPKSLIYRNLEVCNDCLCCEYNCQMNINITDEEYIKDFNCIYCLNCIKSCPKQHCLTIKGSE